jgi:hypothetical protein
MDIGTAPSNTPSDLPERPEGGLIRCESEDATPQLLCEMPKGLLKRRKSDGDEACQESLKAFRETQHAL